MKKRKIANKIFGMITLALVVLLGLQIVFQALYLEQYYTRAKTHKVNKSLSLLSQELTKGTPDTVNKKMLYYSEEMGAATAITDLYGAPLYGLDTRRSFIAVKGEDGKSYKVYIDGFVGNEESVRELSKGRTIEVTGFLNKTEAGEEIYPREIRIGEDIIVSEMSIGTSVVASQANSVTEGDKDAVHGNMKASMAATSVPLQGMYTISESIISLVGEIEEVYIPSERTSGNGYREAMLLQEVNVFLIEVLQGKRSLFMNEPIIYEKADEYVGMSNIVGVIPMMLEEQPVLLVSMISLQGVREAAGIMTQYTLIIFVLVLGIALIGAYWYAQKLTKPLVELRNITTDIASLDFSKSCNVYSQDEIGELADNINKMSRRLKENIQTMQSDLALKEQLEVQRKQLIADISHELKTPLTVMKGTCCGMIDGIYDRGDRSYFNNMLGQINQMSELVQELLEVSRLENEVTLKEEVFILSDILFKVHRELKPLVREKSLEVSIGVEEYMVKGDRKKIETVLRNLYNNAIFYTPYGHEIRIMNTLEGGIIRFEITNTGVCIPEDQLQRIWEPFYRIDHSRNKQLGGSGLGLYMIKQILEKHGSVYGASCEGEQVTFWFELENIQEA